MPTIAEMREKLQGPRRHCDTWYGRNVMRKFSIYLTWIFARFNLTPNHASWASLVCVGLGGWYLAQGRLGLGVLFINLWYLFDHVDGELARHYGRFSATGVYVDTIINFFVQPATFLGLGLGLSHGREDWMFTAGLLGAYGYIMLNVIPILEDLIVLDTLRSKKIQAAAKIEMVDSGSSKNLLHSIFSAWHFILTFPNFLVTLTVFYLGIQFFDWMTQETAMRLFAGFYAFSVTVVWIAQLVQKIRSKKADQRINLN